MKALLICPAVRPALRQLAEAGPLATTPILGECLINHWVEHVAALGARHVIILAADRPALVSAAVRNGERWGVTVEIVATPVEITPAEAAAQYREASGGDWLPAPHDVVALSHLPGCAHAPLFESYASWFAAVVAWMPRALTPARVRVTEIQPGVWVGRRARISAGAQLRAPCWIGDQVFVGRQAVIGEGAIVEDRAVIEVGARVVRSHVAPDTYVGRMSSVADSLALGGQLINWQTDSVLQVPDPFLMCSLARPAPVRRMMPTRWRSALGRMAGAPLNGLTSWWARPARTSDFKLPG